MTEAAELIERAYVADRVAVGIVGNWDTVREELGVPGLGFVPKELAGERPQEQPYIIRSLVYSSLRSQRPLREIFFWVAAKG